MHLATGEAILLHQLTLEEKMKRIPTTEQVWCDNSNNVWIWSNPDRTVFDVWHRHTGGVFPRLFPSTACPDFVRCLSAKEAARNAASMVRAYNNR